MGGRRVKGCNCSATGNYVNNDFLLAYHVDHPVRSVLCGVLHCCRTCDCERGFLGLTSTIPSGAYCAQYSTVVVPATPNEGLLPQPSALRFLGLTSTIPSGAYCAQYSTVVVPATLNEDFMAQCYDD